MYKMIPKKKLTIGDVAKAIGAELPDEINSNEVCGRVLTQAEYATPKDVVISAGWYNHIRVIEESLDKGAIAVFCDHNIKKKFPQKNVIAIDNPVDAVMKFENWITKDCHAKKIAITGSVGKTTTTGLINEVIASRYSTFAHHPMSNSHGAILRNAQEVLPEHEYWVQEVGGVQPGYVESSAPFLKPDIVVLTNISDSHLDLYGSKENIFFDKSSLERYANEDATIIINYDDEILKKAQYSHNVITISKFDENADYYVKDFYMGLDGTYFTVFFKGGKRKIHLNLYGEHNIYNALAAFAVGILAGISDKDIAESLEKYHSSGMRQNLINVGGFNIFVDTFNAEPQTVLGAADTLESLELGNNQRKIFVTGHIDKLGENSVGMHTQLGHDLAKKKLDLIALFNGDAKYTYDAMLDDGCENVFYTDNREQLDNWLKDNVTRNDILFCKSGQFKAALAKSIDHVYGTAFQNEQQYNEGKPASVDGLLLKLRQDNIAEIVGYTGTKSNVVIPSTFEEYKIVRIAAGAFSKNDRITSITIPDTVNSIGKSAFYLCKKLESVYLSKNLRYIGDNAFNSCLALQSVIIPEETIHLGRRAFYDCKSLKTSTLPNSLGFIGKECFGGLTDTVCICNEGSYAHKYAQEHSNLSIDIKTKKNSKFNQLLNKIIR